MKLFNLFLIEVKRRFIMMKRYPLDTIMGMAFLYIFFLFIFLGGKNGLVNFGKTPIEFGNSVTSLILGFIVFQTSMMAFGSLARSIDREIKTGTLEQVFLNPFGLSIVLFIRSVAFIAIQLFFIFFWITVLSLTTGVYFKLSTVFLAVPFIILTIIGIQGIGLIMTSLLLIFKKVDIINSLMSMSLIPLAVLPSHINNDFIYFIPLSGGLKLIRKLFIDGESFFAILFSYGTSMVILTSAILLCIGLIFFKAAEQRARHSANLGQY